MSKSCNTIALQTQRFILPESRFKHQRKLQTKTAKFPNTLPGVLVSDYLLRGRSGASSRCQRACMKTFLFFISLDYVNFISFPAILSSPSLTLAPRTFFFYHPFCSFNFPLHFSSLFHPCFLTCSGAKDTLSTLSYFFSPGHP